MKNYNLVIIGFGGMGEQHYKLISHHTAIKIFGVYDTNSQRIELAKSYGLNTYKSYEDVLNDSFVDILLIATPNDTHKTLSIRGLESGKHVICEKPVTLNSTELEDILAVQGKTGNQFMVHQNRRWDEDYLTMKNITDTKRLGEMYHVEQRVFGSRGIPGDWRKYKEFGGGMLLDWGVHMLDRLLLLIPEPIKNVYCKLSFVLEEEVDDGYWVFIEFESGKTALCEVGTTNFIHLPKWYITYSKGTAVVEDWHMNGKIVELTRVDEKDAKPIVAGAGLTKTMAPRFDNSTKVSPLDIIYKDHNEFYDNFIAVIEKKQKPIVKNEEVLRVMKLIDSLFLSNELKQIINFE